MSCNLLSLFIYSATLLHTFLQYCSADWCDDNDVNIYSRCIFLGSWSRYLQFPLGSW